MAPTRIRLFGAALALAALTAGLAACSDTDAPEAPAAESPETTGDDAADVNDLAAGDCFDLAADAGQASEVPVVPCDEPHDNEAFHVFDLDGEEYPGDDEVEAAAAQPCVDAFEPYVGIDYDSSRLEVFPITPTQESWDGGDRQVICALRDPGAQLEGSMEGAAE